MELRGVLDPDLARALIGGLSPGGDGGRSSTGSVPGGWLVALAAVTVLRLVVAACSGLSPDEAYYWVWSRALAPGYLDHPPMVAVWIRAGCALFGDTALGVRLLAPVSAALGTLLLMLAARDLAIGPPEGGAAGGAAGGTAGRMVRAGLLLNATLALGVGAVTMTPDTPLLFFITLALWAIGRLFATGQGAWWLVAGAALGLACDSKYTALLPGAGLALWLLGSRAGRAWLRTPWPWCAGLLAVLLFLPVIGWNAAHHWVSFVKQGGRTGDWRPARALQFLGELAGGQVGLATPLVAPFLAGGLWRAVQCARMQARAALLACWSVLPAVVFVQHALGDRVQANWPVLLYPGLAIAAASLAWRFWRAAVAVGFALSLLVYVQATLAPLALSPHLDITLRQMAGWPALARAADGLAGEAAGGDGFIAADEYGLASELALALPGRRVIGIEPRWALFDLPRAPAGGPANSQGNFQESFQGIFLCSVRRLRDLDRGPFARIVPVGVLTRGRGGVAAERYAVFRVTLAPGAGARTALLP
ncbi:glycosyltransferase family 39 protein [Nguyenibacter sp. L1]|uniref:glycosyltransferase family 39 protein n=1 Tax=Nguyenibacter sp. L1 TaxID=3049350 RepID=UPI002B4A9E87|nr:glycosyltransferase family 39 protein [Nguyenibacter sp. L1]WRH87806.1 glycosyltransferase family 39 protein [Nguyenibacter sp. L1]